MAISVRKPVNSPAAPVVEGVNFGDLSMYSAGGGLPAGDYVLADLTAMMYQAQDKQGVSKGPPRLGVMITLQNIAEPEAEMRTQFYSMGSNADKSFMPNPETGKSLVAVPGAAAHTLNDSTNWAMFLKSLYDSSLPQGIFSNDLTVLEGTHVHMEPTPEPESRKSFVSRTSEVSADLNQAPKTIMIVTEIKDDGKPWEKTGGLISAKAATKPNGQVKPLTPSRPAVKSAPTVAKAGQISDDDILAAASEGITAVLADTPNGIKKLPLRIGTFKAVSASSGEELASAVITSIFGDNDTLNGVLGTLGYKLVSGTDIVPA